MSPAVYRRRRLVAFLLLAAVVTVVGLLIVRPWAGAGPTDTSASPAVTASPSPTASAAPDTETSAPSETTSATPAEEGDPQPCDESVVSVGASTDADDYAAEAKPELSLSVTNTGAAACTLNVGTSQQQFIITRGSETVWRSTDCQTESSDAVVVLEPDATVASAEPVTWERIHSSPGSCDGEREAAEAGGTDYRLTTSIGGIESAETTDFVLD
ncbi:hypothetical protein D9V30_08455 [Mycetocola reblochoni]|uniref:DUF4232 domain-containing protein n=1 Tax=Mycetocola reblochoni TaxID=331618 RepID=A0A3L6ZPD2_9MICO|nr:hypothetical protein D9V30_08455 [Mycetocola reblochoni]